MGRRRLFFVLSRNFGSTLRNCQDKKNRYLRSPNFVSKKIILSDAKEGSFIANKNLVNLVFWKKLHSTTVYVELGRGHALN